MNEPHYQMRVGMPVSGLGYAVVLKQEINKLKPLRRAKGPFKRLDFLLTFLSMKKVRKTVGEEHLKLKKPFKLNSRIIKLLPMKKVRKTVGEEHLNYNTKIKI